MKRALTSVENDFGYIVQVMICGRTFFLMKNGDVKRGIIELFCGVLCHDHWKPYYRYDGCLHQLCNAHHSTELTRSFEQDGQQWAKDMDDLLQTINTKTHDAGGVLSQSVAQNYDKQHKEVLARAEIECPAPIRAEGDIKRDG
jgi:transposase